MLSKCTLIMLLSCLLGLVVSAQTERWLDNTLKVTDNSGNAVFREEVVRTASGWESTIYYAFSKEVYCTGPVADAAGNVKHGVFTYTNKRTKRITTGKYEQNLKEGVWLSRYPNGQTMDSIVYKNNLIQEGIAYYANGKIQTEYTPKEKDVIQYTRWFDNGKPDREGQLKYDTVYIGKWTFFHKNGQKRGEMVYEHGVEVSSKCYDENGKELSKKVCTTAAAVFPGEQKGLATFLSENLNAKVPVRKKAPVGRYRVLVEFVVNEQGKATEITTFTDHGYGMEAEVLRIIKKMPLWKPATYLGQNIESVKVLPVTFVVTEE